MLHSGNVVVYTADESADKRKMIDEAELMLGDQVRLRQPETKGRWRELLLGWLEPQRPWPKGFVYVTEEDGEATMQVVAFGRAGSIGIERFGESGYDFEPARIRALAADPAVAFWGSILAAYMTLILSLQPFVGDPSADAKQPGNATDLLKRFNRWLRSRPKKMKRYELFGLLALLTFVQPALAQQALVRTYENAALEIGQGYLSHYGDRCVAILPTHVAKEAGQIAAFLREGSEALLGESVAISDLGDDVSVADLSGGITSDCGYSTLAVSRAVGSRIKANALASVRSVNGDGSIAQLSVTIIDDDGERFLRVQPTNDMNQLRKGQSGSLLMSGDTPIGMLLSVNARFGVGKVIRLDKMFEKVDRFVSGGSAIAASTRAVAPTTPTVKCSAPQKRLDNELVGIAD